MTTPLPSPLPTSDPSPINVYDFASVRQKIDKNIRDILVNEQGYQEDFTTNNIKILLGIIACTSAVVAYFKSDPSLVLILCLVYIVFGAIVQLIGMYIEKYTIFMSKVHQQAQQAQQQQSQQKKSDESSSGGGHVIRVEAHIDFPKESNCPSYTLKILSVKPSEHLLSRYLVRDESITASTTWRVSELLDDVGTLDTAKLRTSVLSTLKSSVRKQQKKKQ